MARRTLPATSSVVPRPPGRRRRIAWAVIWLWALAATAPARGATGDEVRDLRERSVALRAEADQEITHPKDGKDTDNALLMDLSRKGLEASEAFGRAATDPKDRRLAAEHAAEWFYIRGRTQVALGK